MLVIFCRVPKSELGKTLMKTIIASMLLFAICMLAVAQGAPDTEGKRTRILALENAWNQAEEHKDTGALDGLLAATLAYTDKRRHLPE
jgi:hypothetical protein